MSKNSDNPVDVEFLNNIVDGDKEFEHELYEIFIENSAQYLDKMQESLKSGDCNAWYMSSHAFKGASASIGFFPLSRVLETAQKSFESDAATKEGILAEAKQEHNKVMQYIKGQLS